MNASLKAIILNDIFIKDFLNCKMENKTIIINNLLDLIGNFNNKEYLVSNLNSQIMISDIIFLQNFLELILV